ncbi:30S ribosomal protein S16 [Sinomicrobium kalidii]|uniref:30S ribosomal protein S16 n=1 Tax=Sinomicrobium kalidii TaxID=2900738 RepID=UPI001E5780F8|nr:30S ribosomal protein S16 [Sinomicrobium kalidii]UGU14219.1 30S ribosomal protein S16 [Sinomicrobium kalidii]
MPVRIRLQRHGRKSKPFYWIVAADSRAKRDGKFLEKLGTYNPTTNPAQIDLNVDSSVKWLQNGAQPSDTARRILSYKGVLLKKHLLGGVTKGALTQEEADAKFEAWLEEKTGKVTAKAEGLNKAKEEAKAKALEAEREISEKRKAEATQAEVEEAEEAAPEAEAAEEAAPGAEAAAEETTPKAEEAAPEAEEAGEEASDEKKKAAE